MKHVCRRCLKSLGILHNHRARCMKQNPANIGFSSRDHLKFEDHHMKIPLPLRVYAVYAEFECIIQHQNGPKVLYTQIPITLGYSLDSTIWKSILLNHRQRVRKMLCK